MKINAVRFAFVALLGAGCFAHADPAGRARRDTNAIASSASPAEAAVLLTPPPPKPPRINGPEVYGVRPGSPFLYRIPCTGERPIAFRAKDLPKGLTLDSTSGIITGKIAKAGTIHVTLLAKNKFGEAKREFRIEVGNKLALTPPMGWNSWYIYYRHVTEAAMRKAADQMIASGMADFGYQYVNCDDCWAVKPGSKDPELGGPPRDANGQLLPNKRFPDIKGMVDYIHANGLKAGIYTSPGPTTCAGFEGSWQHVAQDARTFANWGFDFLKYDWCSYNSKAGDHTLENLKKPYQEMWDELQKQNRDIVFNLCQYGMGDVWKWGGDVGNCWRTTGDLGAARATQLPGFYSIGFSNARHWEYARPGAWNDPDYILIGYIGTDRGKSFKRTTLTPNEQYSYMSMWSLMAAPLIFSGDMNKLDAFTLNVLCNAEVIAVDQDPLGRQAKILRQTPDEFVLVKELEDGSKAVGLFNLSPQARTISVSWNDLGISGKQNVRDLWRQKNLGKFKNAFSAAVPRHGVELVRVGPVK
jgi:alpha-galactosidase